MNAYRRIILEDAAIASTLFTAAWYLYFLAGIGSLLDYMEDGPFRAYATGPGIHVEMLVSGIGLGIIIALLNHLTEGSRLRRMSFGQVILLKSAIYLGGLGLLGILVNGLFLLFFYSLEEMRALWSLLSSRVVLGLALWIVASIVGTNFLMEVRRKVGPGNLWALLTGRYHRPREENRVFLFMDLKNSTGIAEELGHSSYSQFLRECFHDMTEFVLRYGGRIYQYVGDEVVLSWLGKDPEASRWALETYFAFQERLTHRADWYRANFGTAPEFWGAVEVGLVTATEVGDIKRDIAFHGDPLNIAARLLKLGREYRRPILITGRIQESVAANLDLPTEPLGEVLLRGKKEPVSVFGVSHRVTLQL